MGIEQHPNYWRSADMRRGGLGVQNEIQEYQSR